MKLIIPQNIFATLFALTIDKNKRSIISPRESSSIQTEVQNNDDAVALMPVCDLLKAQDLFVSAKFGLAFDGLLSNSYLYFADNKALSEISLTGDVSANEIILAKILFSERYDSELKFLIEIDQNITNEKNFLVAGNDNFYSGYFEKGISFADEIAELLDYPFLNYILVSKSEEALKNMHEFLPDELDNTVENSLVTNLNDFGLSENAAEFIRMNWNSVYFNLLDNELEGMRELVKQIYYYRVIDDIFDIRFVG